MEVGTGQQEIKNKKNQAPKSVSLIICLTYELHRHEENAEGEREEQFVPCLLVHPAATVVGVVAVQVCGYRIIFLNGEKLGFPDVQY